MAKKRPMRQRVKEKEKLHKTQDTSAGDEETREAPDVASSRVQRKVAKSVRFLEKLETTQATLLTRDKAIKKKGKKKEQKGGALKQLQAESLGPALGSLTESLGSALPTPLGVAKKGGILRAKARQKLVLDETKQMSAVLSHPTFQSDPFAAILQHLQLKVPALEQGAPPPELPKSMQAALKKSKAGASQANKKKKKKQGAMRK